MSEFAGFTAVPVDDRPAMMPWSDAYLVVLAAFVVFLLWKHG
jgi:hypothetical protein